MVFEESRKAVGSMLRSMHIFDVLSCQTKRINSFSLSFHNPLFPLIFQQSYSIFVREMFSGVQWLHEPADLLRAMYSSVSCLPFPHSLIIFFASFFASASSFSLNHSFTSVFSFSDSLFLRQSIQHWPQSRLRISNTLRLSRLQNFPNSSKISFFSQCNTSQSPPKSSDTSLSYQSDERTDGQTADRQVIAARTLIDSLAALQNASLTHLRRLEQPHHYMIHTLYLPRRLNCFILHLSRFPFWWTHPCYAFNRLPVISEICWRWTTSSDRRGRGRVTATAPTRIYLRIESWEESDSKCHLINIVDDIARWYYEIVSIFVPNSDGNWGHRIFGFFSDWKVYLRRRMISWDRISSTLNCDNYF